MLAKCNWPDLEELTLGTAASTSESNRIDADSVQILGRTVWKRLLLLSLGRCAFIQLGTA